MAEHQIPEWHPTTEEVRAILDELRPLLRGEAFQPQGDAWARG